jgi:hypothetical protein
MKKSITIILLFLFAIGSIQGQSNNSGDSTKIYNQEKTVYQNRKNLLKISLTSLAFRNYQFQNERVLTKTFSLALSYATIPEGNIPLKSAVDKYIDDPDITDITDSAKIKYTGITPEIRIYMGKGYGKGFYLSLFYRNSKYTLNNVPIDYQLDGGGETSIDIEGSVTGNTFGLLLGTQLNLGNRIVLDWWILGPHYGSNTGEFTGSTSQTLSALEQQSLSNELDDLDIPLIDIEHTVNANGIDVNTSGAWGGVRAGISLGFRF